MKKSIPLILIAVLVSSFKNLCPPDFDLSTITFKQKIEEVVTASGLKPANDKSKTGTRSGYRIFESSDPKIMKFNGVNLAGKTGDSVNRVLIHYHVYDQQVKLIEIKVFSKPEIKKLQDALDRKLGKALYPDYTYDEAINHRVGYFRRIWVEPGDTKAYFFLNTWKEKKKDVAGLAMVDYNDMVMNRVVTRNGYAESVTIDVASVKELMKAPTKKY